MILDKSIICQDCGEIIITAGENIRAVISDINYECKCGSCGVLRMVIIDPNPENLQSLKKLLINNI